MSQASRDTLNRPQCPPQCLNALTAPDHASDNGRFRPLQLPTPVPPLVGSVGSIARQKAASGQPRIEMVCSACAACELWWGIAGLNGFQGSKFICHELWGVRAIIGKASSSETRPIRDTVDAQPGRQAQSRRVARLSTSLSRLQLCAVRTQGCTPSARSGRWLHIHSTGPGLEPRQLRQPDLNRPDPNSHPPCSVAVCLTVEKRSNAGFQV